MRKILYILTLLPLFFACSHIADDEQLIYVAPNIPDDPNPNSPTSTLRTVLLEDFTGQKCVNCPKGTKVIEQLQEAYGDYFIAVGIHGGQLGFSGNNAAIGLATPIGDEYYNHWQLEYQPVGLIDRHGAVNYTDWIAKVREELARESSVRMELEASLLATGEISISVGMEALGTAYSGNLQVWVLEDGITATQTRHEPIDNDNVTINDKNYVHNHVLRTAVNGTWGEAINLAAGEQKTQQLTQAVSNDWHTQNLSIVAFVYNDSGVEQAIKVNITQ
jgi:hypothetical protein